MSTIRTNLIYGNCMVFSPDNILMFRCHEKKIRWYLKRGLATVINDNPLSIRLNFTPKGKGERKEVLKAERRNKCVICGCEDLNKLTKHHLIPYVYRQHFPLDRKGHNSIFIVPICKACHYVYENEHAIKLKKELEEKYMSPMNPGVNKHVNKAKGFLNSLEHHLSKIPESRKKILINNLYLCLDSLGINYNPNNITNNDEINNILEQINKISHPISNYGKSVVDDISDFDLFEKTWANHFIATMSPQYMPQDMIRILQNFS